MTQLAAVDVFLILRAADGRVLFGRRAAHLYAGGQWNLPAGKVERDEDVVSAVCREALEEVGVTLTPADLRAVGVVHTRGSDVPRVGFAFAADYDPARHGVAHNAEPTKCDGVTWADPVAPPQPLETYNTAVLGLLTTGTAPVALHAWETD
ncbi:8-oxo-dGTP pyrophosphatase MutT (NUDIX family) [Allocatelliglobosispora scoriae]|uniref:8-oxo-dGTP pyrophosphatase MutT (NUDIX family) n=1 Tax=Allocatelliglobosispora scoriae TaxID=643052 RepID=A0A841BQ29_9ACTN|nr:NUDIX domain-containing protein [Allocatelliglobosispora scoriae]MBB5868930.1 8-oxo-dGTP pyrophosphatase MutT (NUDIX family) [Allocatelliglobosispora scoriae]